MMARFPAPMAGWSVHRADRGRHHRHGAGRRRCRTACRPATTALLGGAVVFFGTHPKTKRRFVVQSIEGGGWGGRPFEDGESGTVSVCQGDVRNGSIEGIELKCPVVVREPRAAHATPAAPANIRGGLGIDMRVRNLVEGRWNFEMPRRGKCPPWGLWGGTPGEPGGYLLKLPGESEFTMHGRQPHPGAGRRRGDRAHRRRRRLGRSAGARSGAGARTMSRRASSRRRPRASSTAWCSEATCRSTKARPGRLRKRLGSAAKAKPQAKAKTKAARDASQGESR